MKLSRGQQTFILGFLVVTTLTLIGLILGDALPRLRGPAPVTSEWYWPYLLRPFTDWWPSLLAAVGVWLVSVWWLWPERCPRLRHVLAIGGLVATTLFLQLGVIYADNPRVAAALVERTQSNLASGFFEPAAEITDVNALLRDYPAAMPGFVSEHARTHPPGLILANWATIQVLDRLPGLPEALARQVWPLRCTDLWLLDRPPAVAAALGVWSLLPLLAASLSILPGFMVASALLHGRARRFAAVLAATLPALLLFAPKSVQLYAPLALLLFWFFHTGLQARSLWRLLAAGLLLSLLTFLSLGNLSLAFLLAVYALLWLWLGGRSPELPALWPQSWQALAGQAGAFALGALSLWLVLWAGWGVPPWTIAQVGLGQHFELVTTLRRYEWWVVWNLLDLAIFSGWPLFLGFLGSLALGFRAWRRGRTTAVDLLAVALLLLIIVLDLSGSARGEVGRIWLFFMPLLAYPAARFWQDGWPGKGSAGLIVALQLLLLLALGLVWQPVRPVIVVAHEPSFPAAQPALSFNAGFAGAPLVLTGATVDPQVVPLGGSVEVTLFWEAGGPAQRPYTVFNHLLDANGALLAQADGWPVNGNWPPTCWAEGDVIVDTHVLLIPPDAAPGDYELLSGLYDARDGSRVLLGNGMDAVRLGTVQVGPPAVEQQ